MLGMFMAVKVVIGEERWVLWGKLDRMVGRGERKSDREEEGLLERGRQQA